MSTSERQSDSQSNYAGKELLLKTEQDLKHYNAWIVSTFIRNAHELSADTLVLDFGSGIGTLSQIFLKQSGIRPEGVELDDSQRNIYAARGFNAYAQLSETPNAYPLIFTSNVLEHSEDDVAAQQGGPLQKVSPSRSKDETCASGLCCSKISLL